ncbi:hypothetical protein P4506_08515, partial [Geobacillus stearothermophilus]
MSTLEAVVIDGQKYLPIIENDEVIGVKRFNEKHGMWVVVKFMESNVNAERECKLSLYFGTKEPFFCTFLQKALSPFLKECAK